MNGWARIGWIFIIIGGCMTAGAALWAYGVMNHERRQYGWLLVAALAFATSYLHGEIEKKKGTIDWIELGVSLAVCYSISVIGGAAAAGFAEYDPMTAIGVGGILLAPVVVLGLIIWIADGFTNKK